MLVKWICQILNFGRARGLRKSKNKVFSTNVKKIHDLKFNFIDKYCIKIKVPLFEFNCRFQNIDK